MRVLDKEKVELNFDDLNIEYANASKWVIKASMKLLKWLKTYIVLRGSILATKGNSFLNLNSVSNSKFVDLIQLFY